MGRAFAKPIKSLRGSRMGFASLYPSCKRMQGAELHVSPQVRATHVVTPGVQGVGAPYFSNVTLGEPGGIENTNKLSNSLSPIGVITSPVSALMILPIVLL